MEIGIRPLWDLPRVAGPAYTVRYEDGDNLMLHAAIYRTEQGAVIVVESGDVDHALAGEGPPRRYREGVARPGLRRLTRARFLQPNLCSA